MYIGIVCNSKQFVVSNFNKPLLNVPAYFEPVFFNLDYIILNDIIMIFMTSRYLP